MIEITVEKKKKKSIIYIKNILHKLENFLN